MKWINVDLEMPKPDIPVLVIGKNSHGKIRRLRACFIPKFYMEDECDDFQGSTDYNEADGQYYWPEGWYEWNEIEETHWFIDFKIDYWMQLPEPPVNY